MKRSENAPEMQEWFSGIFQAAKEETVACKGETLITNISNQSNIRTNQNMVGFFAMF